RIEMGNFGVKVILIEPGYFRTAITSHQTLEQRFRSLWERLPEELKALYGDNYLEDLLLELGKMQRRYHSDLSLVTDCMEHALTCRYPRTRYSAGWDAKLIYIPLSYLPSALTDPL
ncbi:RDH2 dehydrogenase, partial [Upupa epops]|nr:RDH2 dehydrogenase [Upupa epops]